MEAKPLPTNHMNDNRIGKFNINSTKYRYWIPCARWPTIEYLTRMWSSHCDVLQNSKDGHRTTFIWTLNNGMQIYAVTGNWWHKQCNFLSVGVIVICMRPSFYTGNSQLTIHSNLVKCGRIVWTTVHNINVVIL